MRKEENFMLLNEFKISLIEKLFTFFKTNKQQFKLQKIKKQRKYNCFKISIWKWWYKDFKYENSFSIFEVIFTLIVSSIIIIYSTLYLKEIFM